MPKIKKIERLSNSAGMRFTIDRRLTQGKKYAYKPDEEVQGNEMVSSLFNLAHITEVQVVDDSVIVFQDGKMDWSPLLANIAPFIREAAPIEVALEVNDKSAKCKTTTGLDRKSIARELRSVIDPELGINIVDLGLVYNILEDNGKVTVEFTATTPGCPMRRYLQQHINAALEKVEGVSDHEAKLVWEPSWSVDMIDPSVDLFSTPRQKQWIL